MDDKRYYVYILSNYLRTVLYVGVTNNLIRRVYEHKNQDAKSFTSRYHVDRLVYYEPCCNAYEAISREKQLKAGPRKKKNDMINAVNPEWNDLYEEIAN